MYVPETIPKGQFLYVCPNILAQQFLDEAKLCLKLEAWTLLILPTSRAQAQKIWTIFEAKAKNDKSVVLIVPYSVSALLSRKLEL